MELFFEMLTEVGGGIDCKGNKLDPERHKVCSH